jgi:uncharacterized membrane protein YdjX (TVP38/TMEM64 family)
MRTLVQQSGFTKWQILKIAFFVCAIIALFVAGQAYDFDIRQTVEEIKTFSQTNPLQAALWYVAIFTAIKFLFVPATPMAAFAGYIFGGFLGSLISIFTMTLASVAMFYFGRIMGKEAIAERLEGKFKTFKKYNQKLEQNALSTVVFLRIVPLFPLVVVNMGLGVSRVGVFDYTLGTIIGIAPGMLLLAFFGENFTDWQNPLLYVFGALYVALLVGAVIVKRRVQISR